MDGAVRLRLGNAPVSWGVDYADAPGNPPWPLVLDGIAEAGYRHTELGPVGYLPTDPGHLDHALASRGLRATATFVFDALHDRAARSRVVAAADRAARLLAAVGGAHLVLVPHPAEPRASTAGRPAHARPLDPPGRREQAVTIRRAADAAAGHGIRTVAHQHAGTYLELREEVDDLLDRVPAGELGLCLDTGHAAYAHIDARRLLADHGQRVEALHLKDVDGEILTAASERGWSFAMAVERGVFCPLGRGIVDLAGLARDLAHMRFDGFATVEQDRDPRGVGDPLADARRSRAHLASVGLGEGAASQAGAG
jgi:inosose dehydratase